MSDLIATESIPLTEPTADPRQKNEDRPITRVLTVTLNPAFDRTSALDGLEPERVNKVVSERIDPGGKGVNVSRVLTAFGVPNTAIVLAGQENVTIYRRLLLKEKVSGVFLPVEGAIRENTTFTLPDGRILKVDKAGARVSQQTMFQVDHAISEHLVDKSHTCVVFAGSLPPGLAPDAFVTLVSGVSATKGIRVALDTSALTFDQTVACKPWLIKPNIHELCALVGRELTERRDIVSAAGQLLRQGIEIVLVSLGEDGLLLVDRQQAVQVEIPKVAVKSTVGAGDSALAGFLFAKIRQLPNEKAAPMAAAFGTAAVMTEGTNAPDRDVVAKLTRQLVVRRMKF